MNFDPFSGPLSGPIPAGEGGGADKNFAQRHPLRILIADDNYINRRVLSLLLQRLGYQVDTTESGQDCLASALSTTYDLLLIDINMPDMSGIECTLQIRQAGRDFPIVAVTATTPEASRAQSFAAGMTGYMTKPVRLDELKQTLRDASLARERKAASLPSAKHHDFKGAGPKEFGAGHATLRLAV